MPRRSTSRTSTTAVDSSSAPSTPATSSSPPAIFPTPNTTLNTTTESETAAPATIPRHQIPIAERRAARNGKLTLADVYEDMRDTIENDDAIDLKKRLDKAMYVWKYTATKFCINLSWANDLQADEQHGNDTLLCYAVYQGAFHCLLLIMSYPELEINRKAASGPATSALTLAVKMGRDRMVSAMLKQGEINILNQMDKALETASKMGKAKLVKQLLESFADDDDEYTHAIDNAYASASTEEVKLALMADHRMDVTDKVYDAVRCNHKKALEKLLINSREQLYSEQVDVNLPCTTLDLTPEEDGMTPLMLAAQKGHVECLKLLLNCDDLDVNLTNSVTGKTAVVYAAESEYAQSTFMLVLHPHAEATAAAVIPSAQPFSGSMSSPAMRCVICMNAPVSRAMMPCGHMCVCTSCPIQDNRTCPVCRRAVRSQTRIYFP